MLEQLIRLTSSDDYLQNSVLRIKEVLTRPWEDKEMKITLEVSIDFPGADLPQKQTWHIACKDIMYNTANRIHEPKFRPQIKELTQHPALWNYDSETYFSVSGTCDNIPELMGDLFIAHDKVCGNWVDFHWLYSSLPETLLTPRKNQLAVPNQLLDSCLTVLKKHKVNYIVNEEQKGKQDLTMLLFSNSDNWDDNYSSGQPYLIAKEFSELQID